MQQRTWYSIVQHRTRAALSVVILQRLMRCEHSFMAIAIIWFGGGGVAPALRSDDMPRPRAATGCGLLTFPASDAGIM